MDPREIAKYITDDPDIFNEMAVTGADVAGGIPTIIGQGHKPITRKKKKKKVIDTADNKKKIRRAVNPSTGQPEDPDEQILFSDIPTENPQKPLEEAEEDNRRRSREEQKIEKDRIVKKRKALEKIQMLDKAPIYVLDPSYLEGGMLSIKLKKAINRGLNNARTILVNIIIGLGELAAVAPGTVSVSGCRLIRDFREQSNKIEELKTGNDPYYPTYPPHWLGVQNWNSAAGRIEQWDSFLKEVCVIYLQEAKKLWEDHELNCSLEQCFNKDHFSFLIDLFCVRLSFEDIWSKHWLNRQSEIDKFKAKRRGGRQARPAPELTPDEEKRWKAYKELSDEDKLRYRRDMVSHRGMFPSASQNLLNWGKSQTKDRDETRKMGFLDLEEEFTKGDWVYHARTGRRLIVVQDSPYGDFAVAVVPEEEWDGVYPHSTASIVERIPKNELGLDN